MKKRTAEKIISRSFLVLATYRKSTMGRALRRRPKFWTVRDDWSRPVSKVVRLEFDDSFTAPSLFPSESVRPDRGGW
jgi:hypothetical protein